MSATRDVQTPRHPEGPHGGIAFSCGLLVLCGLVMVYSATAPLSERGFPPHLWRQLSAALLGLATVAAAYRVPLGLWRRAAAPLWLLSVGFLVLTLAVGAEINGAQRWLRVPGLFSFQPSEFAKWATLLFVATLLAVPARGQSPRALVVLLGLATGLPALLLFLQPDTSGALLLIMMVTVLVFVAGAPLRMLVAAGTAGALALGAAALARPYVIDRFRAFLDPWARSDAEGFQLVQSFVAFGRGGPWGVGLGDGRQKLFYLPEAHTDFILSVVGEELGLVGVSVILGAFAAFAWSGMQIALRASTRFGLLLAFAMTVLVALPAALNAAVVMGVAPPTGLALPFVSYGRSALLVSFLAVGVLLAAAREVTPKTPSRSARP